MNRDYWLKQIASCLVPSSDPELAAQGVMCPKPGYVVTFHLPYASVSGFSPWELNTSDDQCLSVRVTEDGHETIHKLPWSNIGTVSIQLVGDAKRAAKQITRDLLINRPTAR
jgi:hypothetical protein